MARPRTFDEVEALDAAVQVFWAHGFAATSVRQLCAAMGIQAGSFYATFESKEHCFRKALGRYLATQGVPQTPCIQAIHAWFDAIVDPGRSPRGCLLVNSASEYNSLDGESQTLVSRRISQLETYFSHCLAGRNNAAGEAALLAASVAGIHVMARSGTAPEHLRLIADQALSILNNP